MSHSASAVPREGYVPGHTVLPPGTSQVQTSAEPAKPLSVDVRDFLLVRLRLPFMISALFFLVAAVVAGLWFSANQDQGEALINSFMESKENILSQDGQISAFGLFVNNAMAAGLFVLAGLIAPLTFFMLAVNGAMVGAVVSYSEMNAGLPAWQTVAVGILPHGVFELTAVFLAAAIGLYTGTYWMRRRKPYSLGRVLAVTATAFFCVVVPLIVVAALVEAFVTPALMNLVM